MTHLAHSSAKVKNFRTGTVTLNLCRQCRLCYMESCPLPPQEALFGNLPLCQTEALCSEQIVRCRSCALCNKFWALLVICGRVQAMYSIMHRNSLCLADWEAYKVACIYLHCLAACKRRSKCLCNAFALFRKTYIPARPADQRTLVAIIRRLRCHTFICHIELTSDHICVLDLQERLTIRQHS